MKSVFNLRLLCTSDIHGKIMPLNYADNSYENKGLAVVSSIMNYYGTDYTIKIDLGDILQGSPLMYFHQLNRGLYQNPIVTCFNHIKYDYFVPGNHDFNYGLDYLKDFTIDIKCKTLCGNIFNQESQLLFDLPYDIIQYPNGPKVAVIGLTTQYIPNWENPIYIKGLKFENAFKAAKKIVNDLKKNHNLDLIILAYHGGFERDLHTGEFFVEDTGENLGSKILEEIQDIDCLITAHQHRKISDNINETFVMQVGSSGDCVGLIDFEFVFDEKWILLSQKGRLIKAEDSKPDQKCIDIISDIENACQVFLDKKIGYVTHNNLLVNDMFMARLHKHPIVTFINEVQLDASNAMISGTALPNDVTGFPKDITIRNVLSTYVYPNTLTVLEVSGLRLKKILEKNAEYFICEDKKIKSNPRFSYPKVQHYNYDMFDGIDYVIDIDQPFGKRIVEVKYQGKPIQNEEIFSLVVNSYRASGGGDFDEFKNLKVIREIPFDIAELIIDYILKHHDILIEDVKNIKIMSKNC
jgi:2',3'-cyclic-nucleotide 2'-phosphodiesterase / 3'-nucleotidase